MLLSNVRHRPASPRLVWIPRGARPDLQLDAVGGGAVRDVEAFVVEGRDRAGKGPVRD